MIYGIILLIIYTTACVYATWIGRTPESRSKWHADSIFSIEDHNKVYYYTAYAIGNIINYSVLGYLIYSLTCL